MTDTDLSLIAPEPVRTTRGGPVNVWELIALTALLGVYLATMFLVGDQGTFLVNLLGPAAFGIILLLGCIPSAMRDTYLIWTPLFWFRVGAVAYFSFGNIITYYVNPISQAEIEHFFAQYLDLITKLNAVTTLGVLLTLGTAFAVHYLFQKPTIPSTATVEPGPRVKHPKELIQVGTAFVVIGCFVKFVFVTPAALGVSRFELPATIGSLALLADAGIYMVAVWAWNFRPSLLVFPFALTFIEIALGLLEFGKTEVIAATMVMALAWLSKGVTVRRIVVTAAVITVTFALIVPFVTTARDEMYRRYHSLQGAGIPERLEIAGYYFNGVSTVRAEGDEEQSGLLRFSYVNCGALALSLFDSGNPGGTLITLPATFVPRALWPDKPDMTVIGREFNYIATGSDTSASSPGWMAEAYWDFGWIGLPIMMIPLGIILQAWSSFSLNIMRSGRWFYFPFCLLGMKMGTSIDGFIVPDVMGTAVLALAAYAAVRVATEVYSRTSLQIVPTGGAQA